MATHAMCSMVPPHARQLTREVEPSERREGIGTKELYRVNDWNSTPLGERTRWPFELQLAVSIMNETLFPNAIFWGPNFCCLFNERYREILGGKRYWELLGAPCSLVFPETWHLVQPVFQHVMDTGEPVVYRDGLFVLERNGYKEEGYFDVFENPVCLSDGKVGGVNGLVIETTQKVLTHRRLSTLTRLGASSFHATTQREACKLVTQVLVNDADITFAAIYLANLNGAERVATTFDHQIEHQTSLPFLRPSPAVLAKLPSVVLAKDEATEWPIAEAFRAQDKRLVRFNIEDEGGSPQLRQALLLPVLVHNEEKAGAVLVVGINPYRALDADYREWLDLVAGHLATALTNAKALEEERRRVIELDRLGRARTAFFANISHEFRTPIMLMLAPLEDMLKEHTIAPLASTRGDFADLLRAALKNVQRLHKQVNNLLDYAAIEDGRNSAVYELTDVAQFTRELASTFECAAQRLGLDLVVNDESSSGSEVTGYVARDMWEKIVLNLLSNALKFTRHGKVEVSVSSVDGGVKLLVSDTGIGIDPQLLPFLLQPLSMFRHPEIIGKGRLMPGAGMGLPLTQELVKLHGGTLSMKSSQGEGTTVSIFIPSGCDHLPSDRVAQSNLSSQRNRREMVTNPLSFYYSQEALEWSNESQPSCQDSEYVPEITDDRGLEDATISSPSCPSTTLPHLLIVDDNPAMCSYLSSLLSPYFWIHQVGDCATAIELLRTGANQQNDDSPEGPCPLPDLVLSDMASAPGVNGVAVVRALRANPRTAFIPCILMSSQVTGQESSAEDDSRTVAALDCGADDFITRPFCRKELIARVQGALRISRLRKTLAETEFQDLEGQHLVSSLSERIRSFHHRRCCCADSRMMHQPGLDLQESIDGLGELLEAARVVVCQFQEEDDDSHLRFKVTFEWLHRTAIPSLLGHPFTVKRSRRLDPMKQYTRLLAVPGLHSTMAAIRVGEKMWGLLHCARKREFSENEKKLIEQTGAQIGLGIVSGQLLQEQWTQKLELQSAIAASHSADLILANTSHELRTPLHAIIALTDLLQHSPLSEKQKEIVATIHDSGESLLNIVSDILSSADTMKIQFKSEEFDLRSLLKSVMSIFTKVAQDKGVELLIDDLPHTFPVTIRSDPGRLRQVLINLINTAIQFSPPPRGGEADSECVRVSVKEEKERQKKEGGEEECYMRVEVCGSGIGMKRLFRPLEESKGQEEEEGEGRDRDRERDGEGLAIARVLVELASGTMGVSESVAGQGSRFWFTWRYTL